MRVRGEQVLWLVKPKYFDVWPALVLARASGCRVASRQFAALWQEHLLEGKERTDSSETEQIRYDKGVDG